MTITKTYERFRCQHCKQEADHFVRVETLYRDPEHPEIDDIPTYVDGRQEEYWCLKCVVKGDKK